MTENDRIDEQIGLEMDNPLDNDGLLGNTQTYRAFINEIRAKPIDGKVHYFAKIGLITGKEIDGLGKQRLLIQNVDLLINWKLSVWASVTVEAGGLPKNYNKIFHRVEVTGLQYVPTSVQGKPITNIKGMLNSITLE